MRKFRETRAPIAWNARGDRNKRPRGIASNRLAIGTGGNKRLSSAQSSRWRAIEWVSDTCPWRKRSFHEPVTETYLHVIGRGNKTLSWIRSRYREIGNQIEL